MVKKGDPTKKTTKVFKPYQDNMNLMIAVSDELFRHHKEIISDFDKKYRLFDSVEIQKVKPFEWTLGGKLVIDPQFLDKFNEETRTDMTFIKDEMASDFKNNILSRVNLPIHFHPHLWNLIAYGDIGAPGLNFSITFYPIDPQSNIQESAEGGMQYASLNIYQTLSTAEKRLADKLLNKLNSIALHKSAKGKVHFNNLVLTLKMIDDAKKQSRSRKTKMYIGYLAEVVKAVKRGEFSMSTLRKAERDNPQGVIIGKGESITSDKIAKGLKVSSGENVRTIINRHKKKMSVYFKKLP